MSTTEYGDAPRTAQAPMARTPRPDGMKRTLRVDFRPAGWRSDLRPLGFIVVLLAIVFLWKWQRADEVARSYSEFWRIDPVELPTGYWFGIELLLLPIELVRLLVRRLRPDPHLFIGPERIESAFTRSHTRTIARAKVGEVRFDPSTARIRFEIPDGLVLIVDGNDLEPGSLGSGPADIARACAAVLEVPLIETSPRRWRAGVAV